jgi:hypothetical protein
MNIFIVQIDWHYETHLCAVFTDKEKAEEYIKVEEQNPPNDGSYCYYHITEMELK